MSITFFPSDDTRAPTAVSFRVYDPAYDCKETDYVKNGVVAFRYSTLEVNCHNSGGFEVQRHLLGIAEPDCCGSISVDRLDDVLAQLNAARAQHEGYLAAKVEPLTQLVLFCKYHGCGLNWG